MQPEKRISKYRGTDCLTHAKQYLGMQEVEIMKQFHFDDRFGTPEYAQLIRANAEAQTILTAAWHQARSHA